MAGHPYRAELARVEPRRLVVAEAERPPRRGRVRAWSDGTTRISLRATRQLVPRLGYPLAGLLQLGQERLQLASGLEYDEAALRWIAQRLRRAIEAAR